jgi:predicted nucleic acid-binding protein
MKKGAVLDSYAVITYLQKQKGYEEVTTLFEECAAGDPAIFLCIVNWGEVIYHALRTGGKERAALSDELMRALPIHLVEANRELTIQAAQIKAYHKLSYADCFAAALAITKKCELVTGDKEFKQLEKEIRIRWIT